MVAVESRDSVETHGYESERSLRFDTRHKAIGEAACIERDVGCDTSINVEEVRRTAKSDKQ